jgi:uncharacterized protein YunC (DUF1805 family)
LVPDSQHQLLYGKKFKVGTGDKEGNMPGERWGCMCGMKILDVDENSYGIKEDKDREVKSIDNVVDGKVAEADNNEVDNGIINSSIVRNAISYNEMKEKKTDDDLIVVNGDEFGEYRNLKDLLKRVKEHYTGVIQDKSVVRDDLGEIEFTTRGIKKTINAAKGYIDTLKVIPIIREVVKYGKNLGERDSNKIRKDGGVFIGIEKNIELDGIMRVVTVLIIKYPNNVKRYYLMYLDLSDGNK